MSQMREPSCVENFRDEWPVNPVSIINYYQPLLNYLPSCKIPPVHTPLHTFRRSINCFLKVLYFLL